MTVRQQIDLGLNANRKLRCAVFMPMLPGYEAVRKTVRCALENVEVECDRLEELLPDAEWQLWVTMAIEAADLILADVTDNNPFVMYELGVAQAHRVPSLLIVNRRNDCLPATVKGAYFLPYRENELDKFEKRLIHALRSRLCTRFIDMSSLGESKTLTKQRHDMQSQVCHWYQLSIELLDQFSKHASEEFEVVQLDEFAMFMEVAERRGQTLLNEGNPSDAVEFFLPRLIRNSDKCVVMDIIEEYARKLDVRREYQIIEGHIPEIK